ncbi:MAG: hypothetical protein AB7V15_09425, partial [Acidimicrobiia bacterium]
GDAPFLGSMGAVRLNREVVGGAATGTGEGYWLAARDGGVFAFGAAPFLGSTVPVAPYRLAAGIAPTPTGAGYWIASSGTCLFSGGTADRTFRPDSHVMLLTDVTVDTNDCWERIVLDLVDQDGATDGSVSYEIGYRDPPFSGPSGMPVPVDGAAFLHLVMHGASGADRETGDPTYTGPIEIVPADARFVRELERVEDFEATLVWVIGLDRRRAFTVTQLDGPDRLVIDIGPPVQ